MQPPSPENQRAVTLWPDHVRAEIERALDTLTAIDRLLDFKRNADFVTSRGRVTLAVSHLRDLRAILAGAVPPFNP